MHIIYLYQLFFSKYLYLNLFLLDLSFWWFYALQAGAVVLSYGDGIAAGLEITLPVSAGAAALISYLLYGAAMLALFWRFGSYVQTTYAVAYDTLRYQCAMPTPKPQPKDLPWDYEGE